MPPKTLETSILNPLTWVAILFLGAVVLGSYFHEESRVGNAVVRERGEIEALVAQHVEEDLGTMTAALVAIEQNGQLQAALASRDREALLELTMPLFRRLQAETEITHLYFTGPDRVNILRLHKPDQYGDIIDRFTTLEAERTGRTAHGIELGPLGTLTVRVVHPQLVGGHCVGYIELGHELSHLVDLLHSSFDVELGVLIKKRFLNRAGWEAGTRAFGREENWDLLPDYVVVGRAPRWIPGETLALLATEGFESPPDGLRVEMEGRVRQASCTPLLDAGGRKVGRLLVIIDTTARRTALVRVVLLVTLACVVGGGLVIALGRSYLGQVEKRLRETI